MSAAQVTGRLGSNSTVSDLSAALAEYGARRVWADGPFALASGASQEASGGTPRTICVVAGRITNAQALGAETGTRNADTERTIAVGWERWGEQVIARCRGSFVVVLWDREQGRGCVARDPLGHCGLFTVRSGGGLLFATEVNLLLRMLPTRPAPDVVAVAHWLERTGVPDSRTLYEGIERLPPGHLLRLDPRGGAVRRYWWPRQEPPSIEGRDEAVDVLGAAMAAAVTRAGGGSPRTGVLLSGGFDSGSIAALAADHSGSVPAAYSVTFPGQPEIDESLRIGAVRRHLGLTGVQQQFAGGSALRSSLEFLLAYELPAASPNGFVWAPLLRRAAADGIEVLLDGEGGDELFGCAPELIGDALLAGRPLQALRLARRLPGMGNRPRPRWLRRALLRYGARAALPPRLHDALRDLRRQGAEPSGLLRADVARLHRNSHHPWAWKREPGPRWRTALLDRLIDASEAIGAHDHLRREAAMHGVSFRHPYRDPELIDCVLAIDPSLSFHSRLDRPLARSAMAGTLVDSVRLSEEKPHFNVLLEAALAGPDVRAVQRLLRGFRPEITAYVDPERLRAQFAHGPVPTPRASLVLWRLITLESWLLLQSHPNRLEAILDELSPERV